MKFGLSLSVIFAIFSVFVMSSCKDCKTCEITTWTFADTTAAYMTTMSEEFCNTNLENIESYSDSLHALSEVTHDGIIYLKWYDCK